MEDEGMRHARNLSVVLSLLMLSLACTPSAEGPSQPSPENQQASKKVVTIAAAYEPKAVNETFLVGQQFTDNHVRLITHDNLVRNPQFEVFEPSLAAEIPSFENGGWQVSQDGTMDVTWHLRPNIKWHDGQPFTSADLVFTFTVRHDPDLGVASTAAVDRLMESVSAPDPLTFIVHWKSPYVLANTTGIGDIFPKHLVESAYVADKQSLGAMALFSTEFIGLGPYRMVRWEPGSFVETARFNEYFMGRPPLDSVFLRFITDPNALVANILSGAVDAVVSGASGSGINLDQAAEVKRRWAGTGNQVLTSETGSAQAANPQYQPEYSRPVGAQTDLRVRKALLQAVDRAGLAEAMTSGLAPVADSYIHPGDPRFAQMQPYIAKFPYDPTRAQQLLVEAGWNKGTDGVYARGSDGQRLEIEFWVRGGTNEKVAAIIADHWNRIGVAGSAYTIPIARVPDREYQATRPGYLCCLTVPFSNSENGNQLGAKSIPTAATNWTGLNFGGYVNPKADAIVDGLIVTLDPRQRLPLAQQLVQEYTDDVALMPLWWQVYPILMVQGIKGPRQNFLLPTMNIFEWDRQ
jgi:peptide/nickel transport system substrate-binding protein